MHVLFFVEEPSVQNALTNLLPRLLPEETTVQFIVFQGKPDLLQNLPGQLRAYASWMPEDWRIVVLLDEDRQDCRELKDQLEKNAQSAGLITKTQAGNGKFQVLNRIAVEELEAWFLGDMEALCQAFPRLPNSLSSRKNFRDPDAVAGGTWETLERILQKYGYFPGGYPKMAAAKQIASFMDPERNRSHSFQVFRRGLEAM